MPPALDLSAGAFLKGNPVRVHSFSVVTNLAQLRAIVANPMDLQPKALRLRPDLAEQAELNVEIQRLLTGEKAKNVRAFRTYIRQTVLSERDGVLPQISLWCPDKLVSAGGAENNSQDYLIVPHGSVVLAIDGQTQLTALFLELQDAPKDSEYRRALLAFPLMVALYHGKPVGVARQYFHDLNSYRIGVNANFSLAMDSFDPIMRVVTAVEDQIPQLKGRVDRQHRQLAKKSDELMTIFSLRQFVINIAKGIAGVQFGSKAVPIDNMDIEKLIDVAVDWMSAYFSAFAVEIREREEFIAATPAVLAAVGAMGEDLFLLSSDHRQRRIRDLISMLRAVDFHKGRQWDGIAGKWTSRGLSVGGAKEVGYAIYRALSDSDSPTYHAIRNVEPSRTSA